jgi:hypothetical protein
MADDEGHLGPWKLRAHEALQLVFGGVDRAERLKTGLRSPEAIREQPTFSFGSLHALKLWDSSKRQTPAGRNACKALMEM